MRKKVVLFPFMVGLILVLAVENANAYTVTISNSGVVVGYRENVLGDNDERGGEKRKEENKIEVRKGESPKKEMEIKQENVKVEVSAGERPKIEVRQERRENKTRVEKMQGEYRGRRVIKKVEDDKIRVEVEDGVTVESVDGELEVEHKGGKVRTNLPVVIDVDTKKIKVKSPETGQEVEVEDVGKVTDGLRSRGLISDLSETKTGTPQSELKQNWAGELVYDLAGTKKERLFGFLPVKLSKQIEVSAQTGEVVKVNQSFASQLLDLFSF